ncbi:unnamed protein product [Orchesella dallaii]|uniref:Uncharacterized protein n=1 Tax=Orchesella dallaii TaxID=48710 RepID=A0ABP1QHD0_9HEXA
MITMLNAKKFYAVQSLSSLRRQVLEYLLSDRDEDYYINPFETFSDVYYHRYSILTDFIEDIILEHPLSISIYHPQVKPGMRLVNIECPEERGKLVKLNNAHDKNLITACLDMDTGPKSGLWKFLDKLIQKMWIISWMFPNFGRTLRTIPYSSLVLEKEHFKRLFIESQVLGVKKLQPQPTTAGTTNNKVTAATFVSEILCDNFVKVNPAVEIDLVLENLIGSPKGIAGYYNSCYLDSLLVSMFYCSTAFDALLKSTSSERLYTQRTRKILHKHVVNPLRTQYYCSSESVMKLRKHLRSLDADVMGSFMDVEQLLYLLVESAMDEPAFIRYNTGATDFMHLMVINPDDTRSAITVQTNFEMSMELTDNLKLKSVPNPALILGLPRSNGKLVKVKAVIPNTELNIQELMVPGIKFLEKVHS